MEPLDSPKRSAELGGCGGTGLAKGAEEASSKRVRDGPQCLDLGDSGAICVVHAAIITAKMSLHKYLCKRLFAYGRRDRPSHPQLRRAPRAVPHGGGA